ncbi:unnamed protein product, partial [Choristocarpus tenellus]
LQTLLLPGVQHYKDRNLAFNPCGLSYVSGGSYIAIGGSDRKASLFTKEGVRLSTVCEKEAWVWAVANRPGHEEVAVCSGDGSVEIQKLCFKDVTSIYEERYAYRENMTDVVVQHLVSEQKVKCK